MIFGTGCHAKMATHLRERCRFTIFNTQTANPPYDVLTVFLTLELHVLLTQVARQTGRITSTYAPGTSSLCKIVRFGRGEATVAHGPQHSYSSYSSLGIAVPQPFLVQFRQRRLCATSRFALIRRAYILKYFQKCQTV